MAKKRAKAKPMKAWSLVTEDGVFLNEGAVAWATRRLARMARWRGDRVAYVEMREIE